MEAVRYPLISSIMSEGENAERPRVQLEENLARDTVEQRLSATGLLLQADKHPEVSRFQCMEMCQHCLLQQNAEMAQRIKQSNLKTRTRTTVNSRTQCLMEVFIQEKKYFWAMKKVKYAFSLPCLDDRANLSGENILFLQAKCSVFLWNLSQNQTTSYVWISSSHIFICEILNMHGSASFFMTDLRCNPSTFQVYTF